MLKRKIFVSALAICLVAIISMGTLAWFSDTDAVKNNFMIAGSDEDHPSDIFSVDLYETDKDGNKKDEGDITNRVEDGITYDNVLPGCEYDKNAFVKNTGKYAQYIRVKVTLSNRVAWAHAVDCETDPDAFAAYDITQHFGNFDVNMWEFDKTSTEYGTDDTITYTLYLKAPVEPNNEVQILDSVNLPGSMTKEDALLFKGGFTLAIKADAVQVEGLGDSCYGAFQTAGI